MATLPGWQLLAELLALSTSGSTWPHVLQQWRVDYIEQLEGVFEGCLCHQPHIRYVCHIVNIENTATTIVGDRCIESFEGEPAAGGYFNGIKTIFTAFKRIVADPLATAHPSLLKYAVDREVLNEQECLYYCNIVRERRLTNEQRCWKYVLDLRLVRYVQRAASLSTDPAASAAPTVLSPRSLPTAPPSEASPVSPRDRERDAISI